MTAVPPSAEVQRETEKRESQAFGRGFIICLAVVLVGYGVAAVAIGLVLR